MDAHVLVIAVDVSEDALQLARENAVGHGVADRMVFVAADLLPHHVDPPYAVVCANLPYVPTGALEALAPELAFEPRAALDGGSDGLDIVRRLLVRLPEVLAADGVALLEIGADQARRDRAGRGAERLPGWRCAVAHDLAASAARAARAAGWRAGASGDAAAAHDHDRRDEGPPPAPTRPDAAFPIGLIALDIDGTHRRPRLRSVRADARRDRGRPAAGRPGLARDRPDAQLARPCTRTSWACASRSSGTRAAVQSGPMPRATPELRATPARAAAIRGRVGRLLRHRPLAGRASPATPSRWCLRPRPRPAPQLRSSGHRPRQGDPSFEDYSGYLGVRTRTSSRTCPRRIHRPVSKVIAVGEAPPADGAGRRRRGARSPGRADATVSHPRFLEFVAPGVSRRAGRWPGSRTEPGIPMSRVMAIGDALNDVEMIAGRGPRRRRCADAPPEVAAVGPLRRARRVEEDGVAGADRGAGARGAGRGGARAARLAAEAEAPGRR